MANLVNGKTVELELVGLNGNAFALMGAFQKQARREGWTKEEIKIVMDECTKGDYNHLLCVLMDHCSEDKEICDEDEEDEGEEIAQGSKYGSE